MTLMSKVQWCGCRRGGGEGGREGGRYLAPRAAEHIFIGGGGKEKKGHYNVKKGTYDAHADNITNVLIKHPCRHMVSVYMFFFLAGKLNKTSPSTHKKTKKNIRALQAQGFWMLSDTIRVLF